PPPPSSASGASGTTDASDSAQNPLPPPPHPTTHLDNQSQGSAAPGSSKTTTSTEYITYTTTTSRLKPTASSVPEDVFMHEKSDFEAQDMVSDDEDIGSRHIPKVPQNQAWFKPLSEEELPSSSLPVPINNWASALASSYESPPENSLLSQTSLAYEVVKAFHLDVIHLQFQMEECHKLLTNQVDKGLLRYNVSRPLPLGGCRLALSITKMKVASYPDAGLEQMVHDQMWAEEEYMYDISASYGISHWWFKRQQFYIDRHSAHTNRRAIVWTHMRILSVVSIDLFSIYGYDYMNKIVLRRSDNQEYTIAKSDFKDLYPSDFEELYLLNLQGHLNYLPPKDKKILSTAVNLWIRNLIIRKRVEDFQLGIENKYGMQMLMRFNEIHKFSDGTLQQIDEALDYRVKEFKVNKNNPALNTRTWKALLVEEYAKVTTDFYGEPNDDILRAFSYFLCCIHSEDRNPARANIKQALVTMADANINAPEVPTVVASPPTRSDEQILPRNKWVPVGKSNCFLDVERTQANPIFKIAVDILKNTNFFKAFTISSTIPSIYIQLFWDTIRFDKDKGYSCQLDEQCFYLSKPILRDAL
ncbi:hypothetical protein Tco_0809600, partial [Tanacetum coccineum]